MAATPDQLSLLAEIFGDRPGPAHAEWRGAPDTERSAAQAAAAFTGRDRCRYALAIVDAHPGGLTDHEAAEVCGFAMHTRSGSRRIELLDADGERLVVDSGRRRLSPIGRRPCAVWVALDELVRLVHVHRAALEEKAQRWST